MLCPLHTSTGPFLLPVTSTGSFRVRSVHFPSMKTRLLSLFLAAVLSVAVMPATMAFAQEHGGEGSTSTSSSPHWSDVQKVAVWSMVGVAGGAVILGVLYTLKRKIGGFPANPSWVAPITIMPSSQLPGDDNSGHEAPAGHDSHAPAH